MKRKQRRKNSRPNLTSAAKSASPRTQSGQNAPGKQSPATFLIAIGIICVIGGIVWAVSKKPASPEQKQALALPPATNTPARPAALPPPMIISNVLPPEATAASSSAFQPDENGNIDAMGRASEFLAQGKYENAIALLKEVLRTNPDDEDVHYNLAIALARSGKDKEALEEYEAALKLYPDYAEAHNNLANLLMRLGRRDDALQHFAAATKITPDEASSWNNYGNALQQVGKTNEAREYFEKAIQVDTNYWQAHYNLGLSHVRRKQFTAAKTQFDTVLRLQPDFVPAKQALARLEKQMAASGTN